MKKSELRRYEFLEKFMIVCGCFVLAVACYISIFIEKFDKSSFFHPEIVVPALNIFCFAICVTLFFKNNFYLQYSILILQSVNTVLIGLELLGLILYSTMLILFLANGQFKRNFKVKLILLGIIWFSICLLSIPQGFHVCIRLFVVSVFLFAVYTNVYFKLKRLLTPFITTPLVTNDKLPPIGESLVLSSFDLTDRQIEMILFYKINNATYGEISEKFNISPSTVKKDMVQIFNTFGVTNLRDFNTVLLQYNVKAQKD